MCDTGPKFSARLRRAKFYERGATELASEFLNCTEKLARFQLVFFYDKVSKNRSSTVIHPYSISINPAELMVQRIGVPALHLLTCAGGHATLRQY